MSVIHLGFPQTIDENAVDVGMSKAAPDLTKRRSSIDSCHAPFNLHNTRVFFFFELMSLGTAMKALNHDDVHLW